MARPLQYTNTTNKKRAHLLVKIIEELPTIKFWVALNNTDSRVFSELEIKFKNFENVKFLGALPQKQMETVFSNTSVFLNTSSIEGFPNTFLQSWSCGIPTITCGINPDGIITKFDLGWVFDIPTDSDIALSIIDLCEKIKSLKINLIFEQSCCSK